MRIERSIEGGIEVEHEVEVDSGGPVLISKRRVVQPGGDMDVGINRADYIHSSDRGACTFRSSNPHLSRAKPAPSYLRVSHRGRWILASHQCSRRNFSFPARDRSPLAHLAFPQRQRNVVFPCRVEGEKIGGNLKKSFGKDHEDQREREEEEERISVQLERSVNTRTYASSRAGEKSGGGSDVIVGSQGRDEGSARHESRS